jgi:sec-independent protein translocase protein TatA
MNVMFGFMNMGGTEMLVVLVLILVFFGGRKIPELAKGLGQGIKEFKKATREVTDEIQNAAESPPAPSNPAPRQVSTPAPVEKSATVPQSTEQKA